ncbi:hypothetical protein GCM10010211_78420 [Streptomyces albospinus]|uniref:Uncharacterized protein n=1 Tax=Streptomyces albospinus TaxID=285515 RepID=A0ABQ2VPP7_9ACTN|nr:hypothetical protein GCM10010211_78420 [Streptomyces albospinus]
MNEEFKEPLHAAPSLLQSMIDAGAEERGGRSPRTTGSSGTFRCSQSQPRVRITQGAGDQYLGGGQLRIFDDHREGHPLGSDVAARRQPPPRLLRLKKTDVTMSVKRKETARGGLSVNIVECWKQALTSVFVSFSAVRAFPAWSS